MSGSLSALDLRLMSVSLEVNAQLQTFDQSFWIKATGCKYRNALQNECEIEIGNLDATTRNYILTETSPFNLNRTPKQISLYAGRVSTGLFLVYQGDVMTCVPSQPPDILLTIKCGTLHSKRGQVTTRSGGSSTLLSTIATGIASTLGLQITNQAQDKTLANYTYSGNSLDEVDDINNADPNTQAFVDDQQLILKPSGTPLAGSILTLDVTDGLIGTPEVTDQGLKVTFLFNSAARLGGGIQLTSKLNPQANGLFEIFKLHHSLCSRDRDFYYIAECAKVQS